MVVEDDADVIALVDLDGGAGRAAVESPGIDGFVGVDFLAQYFGDQMEDFRAAVHGVGKIANIWGDYGRLRCRERHRMPGRPNGLRRRRSGVGGRHRHLHDLRG